MLRYTLSRLGQLLVMLALASIVIFAVIQSAPGDPALIRLGSEATPEQIAIERERLGLDRSLPERYVVWITDAARLDFGQSFSTGLPVTQMIADAFGYTARLTLAATLIALVVGVSLGVASALRAGTRFDAAVGALTAAALSLPSFALGTLLVVIFAVTLRWLPPSGVGNASQPFWASLRYLIMPAITLATPFAVVLTRYVRVTLIETMAQDYVTTARAKGLTRWTVVVDHGLRNALIPTVTVAGLQVGQLLAGAAVTETVFSYPGIGRTTIEAVKSLDYPLVQAALLFAAFTFLVTTFLVDIAYGAIDPRVRVTANK